MKAQRFPSGLYGVTPEWDDTARLLRAVQQAAAGGMRALQLRRKDIPAAQRREQALALAPLCRELGVIFLINDHWELALEIGADGVHVGRDDAAVAQVRAQAPDLIIGASCYNDIQRGRDMLAAGADYIAFGAVFPSSTKPQAVRAPLELLTEARALTEDQAAPRPAVVAIGGITPENAPLVAQAGADAIAAVNGLFEAADIASAAAAYAHPFLPKGRPRP
ncbi:MULTISPECIES: thiamine phosphate synthase [unclassified Achromobacter]|uniref:thiamine phosphate synthase n=1 Tax=unclassified Achromobacter TaxID=2626865 RepID=UPI000B518B74|nr:MULTISPECIES: thiamine phosphate synthase [unclassified Achromobacter]OWT75610.1 thiamine phosphate synthase [Achromobacter sp. HZ28]OWT76271.1 thiamine phosphate synthase [Achromobacter sp. HZ34]